MTPAEEDALVKSCWKLEANQYARYQHLTEDKIRLAIRAAYAQGREDAAKVCEDRAWTNKNTRYLGPELNSMECAAAIRRGE